MQVYVRPAGSYVMDRLELRRVAYLPGITLAERADIVILIANFGVPTGLRMAEAALLNQQVCIFIIIMFLRTLTIHFVFLILYSN